LIFGKKAKAVQCRKEKEFSCQSMAGKMAKKLHASLRKKLA
jgi:hypothetical protein